jgi:hypothetical protein
MRISGRELRVSMAGRRWGLAAQALLRLAISASRRRGLAATVVVCSVGRLENLEGAPGVAESAVEVAFVPEHRAEVAGVEGDIGVYEQGDPMAFFQREEAVQIIWVQAQQLRRRFVIVAGLLERPQHYFSLGRFHRLFIECG